MYKVKYLVNKIEIAILRFSIDSTFLAVYSLINFTYKT